MLGEEERRFEIDLAAALRILETTPHPRAHRSDEDLRAAADILERVEATESNGEEPKDASQNVDKYIYGFGESDSPRERSPSG